jgi:hypothetical protein
MSDATRLAERVAVSWLEVEDWCDDPLMFPDELPRSPSCAAMAPTDILLLLLLLLSESEGVRGLLRSSRLRSKML